MIKIFRNLWLEENIINLIKSIYKTLQQTSHYWWKTKCFPPKIWNLVSMYILITTIQHIPRRSSQCNSERKENKRHIDWKGRRKKCPYLQIVICIENSTKSNKQANLTANRKHLLEVISEFSKFTEYFSIKISIVFFILTMNMRKLKFKIHCWWEY